MFNMNKIMKQAQEMQKKMAEMQEQIANTEFVGSSGGGSVQVTFSGSMIAKSVKIDPQLIDKDDVEVLEDLLVAAINDAKSKIDQESQNNLSGMMGGMQLPAGMKFPF